MGQCLYVGTIAVGPRVSVYVSSVSCDVEDGQSLEQWNDNHFLVGSYKDHVVASIQAGVIRNILANGGATVVME